MEKQSSWASLKNVAVDIWDEFHIHILVVLGIIVSLFIGGGVYRVSNGEPFWGAPETSIERNSRLIDCAEATQTELSPAQQMDSGGAGVCSGFTKKEIEQTQAELGL